MRGRPTHRRLVRVLFKDRLVLALARVDARLVELQALRAPIIDFNARLSAALARGAVADVLEADPGQPAMAGGTA